MPDKRFSSDVSVTLSAEEQQKLRTKLANTQNALKFIEKAAPLEDALISSANSLYEFFHDNGYMLLRTDWEQKPIPNAPRSYLGWVYTFYGKDDIPLYIGETGRTFAARFTEHEKDKQIWWPH